MSGPFVWKWDPSTNQLKNFSLSLIRKDLFFRVNNQQHLFTLEECKIILREVSRIVTQQAQRDFEQLMFLSTYRNDKLYPKPIQSNYIYADSLQGFSEAIFMEDEQTDPSLHSKERLHKLIINVNKNLIKLIDSCLKQRKERMLLLYTIIEEIEQIP